MNDIGWSRAGDPDVAMSIAITLFLFVGVVLLIYWLASTSFGRTALDYSPLRRNAMAFYIPLIPFGVWIFLSAIAGSILSRVKSGFADWQQELLVLGCTAMIALAPLVITPCIVRGYFVRGFKGFGLDPRTIGKDIFGAAAKFIAVCPLVFGTLLLTVAIGKLIFGPDFEIQKHEELESLIKYPQWLIRVGVFFLAVVIAPLTEEVLFRGLFQSMFRNFTRRPWDAVLISSAIFAMAHANPGHWPALFVFAIGLGYAYEKSGSLFQPIFMHAFFNGVSVVATLLQS
ncbi:MAG: CPBP family intramembrane metalloprotease [Sedimentisphaerales bacterium]|nr:CPBP family intramembrane metalloprotease [Sedimentisphaerales bacterium]